MVLKFKTGISPGRGGREVSGMERDESFWLADAPLFLDLGFTL